MWLQVRGVLRAFRKAVIQRRAEIYLTGNAFSDRGIEYLEWVLRRDRSSGAAVSSRSGLGPAHRGQEYWTAFPGANCGMWDCEEERPPLETTSVGPGTASMRQSVFFPDWLRRACSRGHLESTYRSRCGCGAITALGAIAGRVCTLQKLFEGGLGSFAFALTLNDG